MITVVLKNQNDVETARLFEPLNHTYLIREGDESEYPYLSELSLVGADVFASSRMAEMIAELEKVKKGLTDSLQIAHVEDTIRLANICCENEGYTLMFTPFGEFLDNPIKPHALRKPTTV